MEENCYWQRWKQQNLKQKHTVEYSRAVTAGKEEMLAAADVQPKSKQKTQERSRRRLAGCTPYDRKVIDAITWS